MPEDIIPDLPIPGGSMARHFVAVALITVFASIAIRLFITNFNVLAGKVGLKG